MNITALNSSNQNFDYYHRSTITGATEPLLGRDISTIVADYATRSLNIWKNNYGVTPNQNPPLPPEADLQQILNEDCPFWKGKKKKDTHDVLFIPEELDGEVSTYRKIGALSE